MVRPLHTAAVALARKGMAVFPCAPRNKFPATSHGVLDATRDVAAIDRWWTAHPDYNIAIATGTASNVFVLDIDSDDAETAIASLESINAPLPATVATITGRGRHLWFRMPEGVEIRNSASKISRGIDVRGEGGYALAPPSIHPSGRKYCWSVDSTRGIAEAPKWLIDKVTEQASSNGATPPSEWIRLATEGVVEGARNDSIARLTGHLLRRYVDPRLALEMLRCWNAARCRPPLGDAEVEQVVESIASLELRRRQETAR